MKEVVIVDAVRTPSGNHGGALRTVPPQELGATVIRALVERNHLDPATVDHVIMGCVAQPSDAANIARVCALMAGLPVQVPAITLARNCDSAMDAIIDAWRMMQLDEAEIIIAGGTESMSNIPYLVKGARWGLKLRHSELTDGLWEGLTDPICGQLMGRTAENLAEEFGIPREDQDQFAVQSHKKAFMATRMGKFADEIVPVEVVKKVAGQEVAREPITQDETINPALSTQKAALYPTIFKKNGTVTPANACGISDGASAVLICTAQKAKEMGWTPLAYYVAHAYAGVEPERMGIAPSLAMPRALRKAGLSLDNMDLVEVNEAFASQVLSVGKAMEQQGHRWDWNKFNVNGGAIALGHPVGSSGCRIIVTMLYELKRRNARYGLASLCAGGGQGSAVILERRAG
jgi:acetyl-CoA C-acetyltransferase